MKSLPTPKIYDVSFDNESLATLKQQLRNDQADESELIFEYPTVYIVNNKSNNKKYNVYIGETTDISSRTRQHIESDPLMRSDWQSLATDEKSRMFVIGNEYFNKSLTLDIENRLMHYLSSSPAVEKIYNRRTNQQNKYYTSDILDDVFRSIWRKLRQKNKTLFPLEEVIRDSALFKASPFHKLTQEQVSAKEKIKSRVINAYDTEKTGQFILVAGEAGSGKTVLMSNLFYDIFHLKEEYPELAHLHDLDVRLIVNHDEQLKVYDDISVKLGMKTKANPDIVVKPTRFINNETSEKPADVVIIDEAHLLWTQGKQSYRGKNQLNDLLDRAKIVVAVFDFKQVLTTEQYWEENQFVKIVNEAKDNNNYIYLSNQMRINADEKTVQWIRSIVDDKQIYNLPMADSNNYDIKVFDDIADLDQAIQEKAENEDNGISRLIATFDWRYVNGKRDDNDRLWMVKEGDWEKPWNLQLKADTPQKRRENKRLSWAEQDHTIHEVGSTYTIQGFDLNYAGLIIGPSVKYRDGRVVFDRQASENKKATRRRTLEDGSKEYLSDELLRNELNVLLTRGINGLYIYAVDPALRDQLLKAQEGKL